MFGKSWLEEIRAEQLRIAKELDVKTFMTTKAGCELTEDQALKVLHYARYQFARAGHLARRYLVDSRNWLRMKGYPLPGEEEVTNG